jgi:hypothetical protein
MLAANTRVKLVCTNKLQLNESTRAACANCNVLTAALADSPFVPFNLRSASAPEPTTKRACRASIHGHALHHEEQQQDAAGFVG